MNVEELIAEVKEVLQAQADFDEIFSLPHDEIFDVLNNTFKCNKYYHTLRWKAWTPSCVAVDCGKYQEPIQILINYKNSGYEIIINQQKYNLQIFFPSPKIGIRESFFWQRTWEDSARFQKYPIKENK